MDVISVNMMMILHMRKWNDFNRICQFISSKGTKLFCLFIFLKNFDRVSKFSKKSMILRKCVLVIENNWRSTCYVAQVSASSIWILGLRTFWSFRAVIFTHIGLKKLKAQCSHVCFLSYVTMEMYCHGNTDSYIMEYYLILFDNYQ